MKHIISTRIKFDDDILFEKYFQIMKDIYVPSILSQKNSNFEIGFIINNKHKNIIESAFPKNIKKIFFEDYDLYFEYVKKHNIEIQTRHDCDDWMSEDYVEEIQKISKTNIGLNKSLIIQTQPYKFIHKTNEIFKMNMRYSERFTSMFLSVVQKKVEHSVFEKNHKLMWEIADKVINLGEGYNYLTIHENNKHSSILKGDLFLKKIPDLSIIIPTFKNEKYLENCLDSVIKSSKNHNCEILLGIDNCTHTLNFLTKKFNKYKNVVKFFFFEENVGPYIIKNTLGSYSKSKNLLFFDSDDVMCSSLITEIINGLRNNDCVRFYHQEFKDESELKKNIENNVLKKTGEGVFAINKRVFLSFNGFEPWRCAADTEFKWRMTSNHIKTTTIDKILFFRRRHSESLTLDIKTGPNSLIRKTYRDKIIKKQVNRLNGPLNSLSTKIPKLIVSENQIPTHYINVKQDSKKKLTIIIPTFSNINFIEETFTSVIKSIKNINCEILVGIDNCVQTLNYVKTNQFDSRIKFYFFEKNVGPYVIKNSLAKISNSDILLFFDSDDIMSEKMVVDILSRHKVKEMVKPKYVNFYRGNINDRDKKHQYGEGVFSIKKSIFLSINGFEPWRCAADSDIMGRLYKSGIKFDYTKDISFFRRVHKESLTQKPGTNYGSKLRAEYIKLSKSKKGQIKLPNLVTEKFYEVNPSSIVEVEIPVNIETIQIPTPEVVPTTSERLKGLLKGEKPKKVDYDKINDVLKQQGIYNPNLIKEKPKIKQNNPVDRNKLIEIKKDSAVDSLRKNLPGKPNRRKDLPNIFSRKNRN